MSMLGDLAFGAIDSFIKVEAQKIMDSKLESVFLSRAIDSIPHSTRRDCDLKISGHITVKITDIKIGYDGVAMRKTQTRSITMNDQTKEIDISSVVERREKNVYARLGSETQTGPSADIALSSKIALDHLGVTESMGGISATINSLSCSIEINGRAESTWLRFVQEQPSK